MNRPKSRFDKGAVFSRAVVIALLAVWLPFLTDEVWPADSSTDEKFFQWGGEIKNIGAASWPGSETLIQPQGDKTFYDGLIEGQLIGKFFFTNWVNLEIHDLIGATGGDTLHAVNETSFPVYLGQNDIPGSPPSDKRQLFDMSWNLVNHNDLVVYDRVDRLRSPSRKGRAC